jgi:hypothetical protein
MTTTPRGWPAKPFIKRDYACIDCGKMRRAPAYYIKGAPPPPQCCKKPMRCLSYEQTVAANRLTEARRMKWLMSGGHVAKARGSRRWKAVTAKS